MTKIYKNSKDMFVESTILYPKDDIMYSDVTHDTPLSSDELKEVFLKDSIIDISKGSYGSDSRILINPTSYGRTAKFEGTENVSFGIPVVGPSYRNMYPGFIEEDIDNITIGGENLGQVRKNVSKELHQIEYTFLNYAEASGVYIEFGLNSKLNSVLHNIVQKYSETSVPRIYVAASMYIDNGTDEKKIKYRFYEKTWENPTVKSGNNKMSYTLNTGFTPSLDDGDNVIRLDFPVKTPYYIRLKDLRISLKTPMDTSNYYEPYHIEGYIDPYYAEAKSN